ncbi:hypothetical protein CPLU01_12235 [Colletotrichum plurivorum]|uniref:Uncharacterized protein n=1 Tax=Colletotrichum plurivorum TaxID=2175906 RepID=A0A8H6JZQ1_9PEZI|nr:hypothetical protein CPLU01_12235 [Colletotrichum plurivorum]
MSSTHPLDAWQPAKMDRDEFRGLLRTSFNDYHSFATLDAPHRYSRVRVLTLCWEADLTEGLNFDPLINKITDVFRRHYNYATRHCSIPRDNGNEPRDNGNDTDINMDKDEDDSLLIVYYIGLAQSDASTFRLYPSTPPTKGVQASVDWSHATNRTTKAANCDVLLLMDSCYSSLGAGPGCYEEVLAATSHAGQARWDGPSSFTFTLAEELAHTAGKRLIVTATELFAIVAARAFSKDRGDRGGEEHAQRNSG